MKFEAMRAQTFFSDAEQSLPAEDRGTLLTAEAMRLIYGDLLRRIVRVDYRVFDHRCRLSAPRKLFLVGRAWASGHLRCARP
jgi:phytoene synthase